MPQPNKLKVFPGKKFGKLTIIREIDKKVIPSGQKLRRFLCQCECGKYSEVLLLHLNHNRISSCGCGQRSQNGESQTKLYTIWNSMRTRCYSDKYINRNRYK